MAKHPRFYDRLTTQHQASASCDLQHNRFIFIFSISLLHGTAFGLLSTQIRLGDFFYCIYFDMARLMRPRSEIMTL